MKPTTSTLKRLALTSSGAVALGFFSMGVAHAQNEAPAQPSAAPAEQPATPAPAAEAPSAAPAAEAPPASEAAPTPTDTSASVEDRLAKLEGQVEGMGEPFSALQADMASLKKLKFSGYLQGRWERADDSAFGIDKSSSAPLNKTYFYIRRARLKAVYTGQYSEFLLQIDAPSSVSVKDAEASLVLSNENMGGGGNWELKLTLGQFKVPFGFEVLQSSGDREFPERVRFVRAMFPGERDRGVRLQFNYEWLRTSFALINGIGLDDAIYGVRDQSTWKDLVGRVGVDLDWLVGGVSGYFGHYIYTQKADASKGLALDYRRARRTRLGADVQLYYDVPEIGGLTVRGEFALEDNKFLKVNGVDPGDCLDHGKLGWYVAAVQNVGEYLGVAVRYDVFDPSRNVNMDGNCAAKIMDVTNKGAFVNDTVINNKSPGTDTVKGLTISLLGYISGNLKATLAWEHLMENAAVKKDNDIATVQMQAKF